MNASDGPAAGEGRPAPAGPDETSSAARALRSTQDARVVSPSNGASVALIVDDDSRVRAMLVELLSKAGFRCVEAADGEEALGLLGDHTPHLSILDLALPGMSGAELAWKLRKRLPEAPIVALSGHLASWDQDDLKDLGFDRIFPKPMDCDDFLAYCRGVSGQGSDARPS